MIIDGKAVAQDVLSEARSIAEGLSPSFLALAVSPSPATLSYLSMKRRQAEAAGIHMEVRELPGDTTTEELLNVIQNAPEDAVIVQLPLPESIDTHQVLAAIPIEKDADVLSQDARDRGLVAHPIAASVKDILARADITVRGMRSAVVGQGWLVGKPVSEWLSKEGADVQIVTKESDNLERVLPAVDLIVSGAGSPGIVTPELVKEGVVAIDVGTSELGGSLHGDIAPEVAEKARLYTPVPGGVGPIAVAYLMKNVAELARLRARETGVH